MINVIYLPLFWGKVEEQMYGIPKCLALKNRKLVCYKSVYKIKIEYA